MKKTILKRLNAVLGAAVVGLTGASTGCKTAQVAPAEQISPAEQEKDRIIEELRMELDRCRQAQENREEERIRLLYGPPPARYEVQKEGNTPSTEPKTTTE